MPAFIYFLNFIFVLLFIAIVGGIAVFFIEHNKSRENPANAKKDIR